MGGAWRFECGDRAVGLGGACDLRMGVFDWLVEGGDESTDLSGYGCWVVADLCVAGDVADVVGSDGA